METNIYNVDYFIKKFTAIPEERWMIRDYHNEDRDKFCALGFCGSTMGHWPEEAKILNKYFEDTYHDTININVAEVNDGSELQPFKQPTPKQRILAALYDIYEKTYGRKYAETLELKEKVIYKTVVIDSAVKTLQETLSEN